MSITWEFEGTEYKVLNMPIRKQESNIDISLTFSFSEALANVFFFTSSAFSDIVSAKKSTESEYLPVQEYSTTPSCYVGDVGEDEEITIDFRFYFSSSYTGEQVVPIYVGHGSGIVPLNYPGLNFFWLDDSTDDPFHWYNTTEEGDSSVWHGDY